MLWIYEKKKVFLGYKGKSGTIFALGLLGPEVGRKMTTI